MNRIIRASARDATPSVQIDPRFPVIPVRAIANEVAVLDAGNVIEAVRLRPERLCVIARGKVVAERTRQDTRLSIAGRPAQVNRRHKAG